ncbi:MAG: SulP family inorganic anion transporter [Actinomycetota bacterium]|nr:SulP family inorganic anion transporter [Actinomycetota bacterium]
MQGLLPQRADWSAMRRQPRRDLLAGVMVGLVALPLALGFGASSGMGAGAGLVTAIVAGVVAALFGGSHVQVSGPTGAMTVVLVPIVATYGPQAVLTVGLLAGLVLVGLALLRAGRFIRYVPVPVVEGFTVGIAVIIALQQLPAVMGVHVHGEKVTALAGAALADGLGAPHWPALAIAGATVALILGGGRLRRGVPFSLIAIVVATGLDAGLHLGAETISSIPSSIPAPRMPSLDHLGQLLVPAVAVAALAALESLLSASVADGMSVGQRHDSDRELFGQGLANIASPIFGGIPATAAIARTAVNVRAGATSRAAAVVHALVLLVIVLVASRWVSMIPLAALAGVLVATAVQMVRVSSVRVLLRSTRGDAVVLVVTAVSTVALDLVTAVVLGLVVAGGFALHQAARAASLQESPLDASGTSGHDGEERSLLDEHVVAYRLEGPLFFAAAHDFLLELSDISDVRVVVLRMGHLSAIDATGAAVLADTIRRLESRGVTVMLSGVKPVHERVLTQLGVYGELTHERHLFASTPEAIAHARVHAARVGHVPGDPVATGPGAVQRPT